jgi:hypothetical protein
VLLDGGWLARRNSGTATLYHLVLDDLAVESRALWLAVRAQMGDAEAVEDSRRLASVLAERAFDSSEFFGAVAGEWDSLAHEPVRARPSRASRCWALLGGA